MAIKRWARATLFVAPTLAAACAGDPDRQTLAKLHAVEPDLREVKVENSLDQAIVGYRKYLDEAPESELKPEAMRRLADLKLEKEFGILGDAGSAAASARFAPAAERRGAMRTSLTRAGSGVRRRVASEGRSRRRARRRRKLPAASRPIPRARARRSRSTTRSSPSTPTIRRTIR
jgi:hypothetical protein